MSQVDKPGGSSFWPRWLTPKQIASFIANVASLTKRVERLEAHQVRLRSDLERLKRQNDDQTGQLKVLSEFVREALFRK